MSFAVDRSETTKGPLAAYRGLIRDKKIISDPAQALAAERLQDLWAKLRGYDPAPQAGETGLFARLLRRKKVDEAGDYPHGLYLVGDVGRGKSMLMDLFFACADVPRKRRIHFHHFMQEAHATIHQWRVQAGSGDDPIPPLADTIAAQSSLLCFDEFQINDIADAMLLGRLFQALFIRGVVVVATSNTIPDALFAGRPGRDAFLPFIALLKQNLDVLVLEAAQDYRLRCLETLPVWIVPADEAARHRMDAAFRDLSAHKPSKPMRLPVSGRWLDAPITANGVARFEFAALCGTALGAGDYLALATNFHTIVLDNVPMLTPEDQNEARRFITLIDALYDYRVKLLASAAGQPDELYKMGEGAGAFERTASRLQEMRTPDYQALPHMVLG
jgi:cell division protein ZapE